LRALGVALELHDVVDRPLELLDDATHADVGFLRKCGQLPDVCCAAHPASGLEADPGAGHSSKESAHRADAEPAFGTRAHQADDHRGGHDDSPGKQVITLFDGAHGLVALGVWRIAHGAVVRFRGLTLGAQSDHVHPNTP
jgi:hypothetical protein